MTDFIFDEWAIATRGIMYATVYDELNRWTFCMEKRFNPTVRRYSDGEQFEIDGHPVSVQQIAFEDDQDNLVAAIVYLDTFYCWVMPGVMVMQLISMGFTALDGGQWSDMRGRQIIRHARPNKAVPR